jgi:hypothetical protein
MYKNVHNRGVLDYIEDLLSQKLKYIFHNNVNVQKCTFINKEKEGKK